MDPVATYPDGPVVPGLEDELSRHPSQWDSDDL